MPTLDEVLDCLNHKRIRATYEAVGEVIGRNHRRLGDLLGAHSWRTSWVVLKRDGQPSGFSPEDKHPDLMNSPHVISTGAELLEECRDA